MVVPNKNSLNSKSKGFSLIELMLATSLLMMVMFSGYYAYSLYTQKWQKRVDTFWQGTQHAIALDTMQKLLESAIPYVIKNDNGNSLIYFSADSQNIEFVTGSPIYSASSALVSINIEQTQQGYQLVYLEKSLSSYAFISLAQLNNKAEGFWDSKTVLIPNFEQVQYEYYGWLSFNDGLSHLNIGQDENRNPAKQEWYTRHEPEQIKLLPSTVRMKMTKGLEVYDFKVSLPDNSIYFLLANIRKDTQ